MCQPAWMASAQHAWPVLRRPGCCGCHAGTVLAAEMQPREGEAAGYGSAEAKPVTAWLRARGVYARPLGNVVYFMVTPTTRPQQCTRLLRTLLRAIEASAAEGGPAAPLQEAAAHAA